MTTTVKVKAAGLDDPLVVEGFRQLLPVAAGVEPHLGGVITDALEHPGSLLRAQLVYSALRRYGVGAGPALRAAVAIEYFHTASLIFDDMPAMDDARERRGRPCPHVTYGEAAATLGALALINQGYALLWEVLGTLPPTRGRAAARLVASCLGAGGILNGQALDLHFSGETDGEEVLRVAEGKTVSLIRLTLLLPAIVGGAGAAEQERLDRLATAWGLAYQILDDFKDFLMSRDETGKSTHRDQLLGRPNLPRQAGFGPALEKLDALLAEGRGVVAGCGWEQLGELQAVLERERRQVAERLPVEAPAVLRAPETVEPRRFAARQLERWAGQEKTVLVTVPAPRVAAEALLAVRRDAAGFLWDPGQGAAWAGAGTAHALAVDGDGRFARLRRDAERLWPRLVTAVYGSARVPAPRLYGGLAFDAGATGDELWRDFGDGAFVLPRWLYGRQGREAWLTLAARGEELAGAGEREACLAELAEVLEALAAYRARATAPRVVSVHSPDLAGWCAEVEAIRRAIRDGRCAKVVAARRSRVVFDAPLDAAGDGELAVALRCAVVRGAEACLFAGAGIVAESDPRREYAEIELKRRAMLAALGG